MKNNDQLDEKMPQKMRKKELLLLVIVFIVIVVIALVFYGKTRDTGDKVIVTVNSVEYGVYPLNENQEIPIKIDGVVTNYLVIEDGYADVTDANCPDKLCVNMKSISKEGESIVCLPNKVIVEIESKNSQSELDVMAQ